MKRNPKSPFIPKKTVSITPESYEKQVVDWLRASGPTLENFVVKHRETISGPGGNYEFDAVAEFTVLREVQLTILIECKRHKRPIQREVINALHAKMLDVNAHKAIVFSTSGFQSGAIGYATSKNIALVALKEGSNDSETIVGFSTGTLRPSPEFYSPKYIATLIISEKGSTQYKPLSMENTDALAEWIQS